ncbi:tyrosine-type recombinase/integrase [Geoalkalibacter halelectricus]|uniref:Integrase arm-type DNA-binding domain-containing protein n=1 Tax=Geoalkalibacter halelectricus TaxID=2847045 RepID=A0ABY5ZJ42_9BACT|nr:integrase arm-type DNA-binding domain-containing protein [Geoalkalibacter halelectricus]MDO3376557.1 integrase arm-type DNA-binding domain-containing protein [Geoalkalibacter halelectricus]UWZ78479.1 integrase arm-type DNA-binding domain-containing protein [Geoalkalibacter halelectricus]
MPKRIASLTDLQISRAKPQEKQKALFDGGGLFLLVTPAGGKLWRFKYRFSGKEKILAFGAYPEISLGEARQRREEARKHLANGVDPGEIKKSLQAATVARLEEGFEVIAREWHGKFASSWSTSHAATTLRRLEADVFPVIGDHPLADIKAPELLAMLRRVEARGALETAHRIRTICGQVFRYAIATGRADRDPAADLKGALPPYKPRHLSAITDPAKVGDLLRAIDGYQGSFVVKSALQLAPLVFVRPGELRQAQWAELDLDRAEWNIPAERMKIKKAHGVPLSGQAVAILRELKALTGRSRYLFPSARSNARPLSDNALNAALRRMGFEKDEMTTHGFRALARTILDEVLGFRPEIIEHQLAHVVKDPLGRAYNRTTHLGERKRMMQDWADYLDGLKAQK